MEDSERTEWQRLVRLANRLGREGKRVRIAEVILPTSAADIPIINLSWDYGSTDVTED
jgi:hypothetical protein